MENMIDVPTQPLEKKQDINWLLRLKAELMQEQSNPRLKESQRKDCVEGIRAVSSAIEALEMQVLA